MWLPLTAAEFNQGKGALITQIAEEPGIDRESITFTVSNSPRRRMLLQAVRGVMVIVSFRATSTVSLERVAGLNNGVVLSEDGKTPVTPTIATPQQNKTPSRAWMLVVVIVCAVVICGFLLYCLCIRRVEVQIAPRAVEYREPYQYIPVVPTPDGPPHAYTANVPYSPFNRNISGDSYHLEDWNKPPSTMTHGTYNHYITVPSGHQIMGCACSANYA